MIGVDLAKSVFQLHGASATGQVLFRKKLSRPAFTKFMAEHPPVTVVLEACGSAHYWARELSRLGLIAAQYVRPFVKRQKNDAADAEAIVIAAQRPEMRFVEAKTAEQQSRAMLFRARVRLVRQRTELVNMLRAFLYELGYVVPQGIHHLPRIATIIADPGNDLPEIARMECNELLEQIEVMTVRIATSDRRIKSLAGQADISRRLQTMPGVGPLTALAVEAFAPPMETFKCGRQNASSSNLDLRSALRLNRLEIGILCQAEAQLGCRFCLSITSNPLLPMNLAVSHAWHAFQRGPIWLEHVAVSRRVRIVVV